MKPEEPHQNGYTSLTDFSLLKQEVEGIKSDLSEFRSEVRGYFSRSSLRSLWPMIVGIAAFMYFMLNQTVSNALNATTREQADIKAKYTLVEQIPAIMAQNAQSKQDRDDQRAKTDKMFEVQTNILKELARESSRRIAKNYEIETQLKAHENDMNMTRKWNNTMIALLWKRAYGEEFPEFQVYPEISHRDTTSEN